MTRPVIIFYHTPGAAASLSGFADLGSHAGHPHLRGLTWAARFVGTSTPSSSSSVLSTLNATSSEKPSPILQQERSLLLSPQECVCASHSCSMSKAPSSEFSAWHVRWPGIWFLSPPPKGCSQGTCSPITPQSLPCCDYAPRPPTSKSELPAFLLTFCGLGALVPPFSICPNSSRPLNSSLAPSPLLLG